MSQVATAFKLDRKGLAGAIRLVNCAFCCAVVARAVLIAMDLPHPSSLANEGRQVLFTFVWAGSAVVVMFLANLLQKHIAKAAPQVPAHPARAACPAREPWTRRQARDSGHDIRHDRRALPGPAVGEAEAPDSVGGNAQSADRGGPGGALLRASAGPAMGFRHCDPPAGFRGRLGVAGQDHSWLALPRCASGRGAASDHSVVPGAVRLHVLPDGTGLRGELHPSR